MTVRAKQGWGQFNIFGACEENAGGGFPRSGRERSRIERSEVGVRGDDGFLVGGRNRVDS